MAEQSSDKQARLKAALRANLRKRKEQERDRRVREPAGEPLPQKDDKPAAS